MSESSEPTIVSASGKVLLAGGYLVLDQKYSGVVVSTSSRFFTAIESASHGKPGEILVRSPQFVNAEWVYELKLERDALRVSQQEGAVKNKFVHIALQTALRLAREIQTSAKFDSCLSKSLRITIVGGNDFYSQRAKLAELGLEPCISSLAKIPPFAHTGVAIADVHKTGLGSSAALTTSLVGALLLHFGVVPSVDPSVSPSDAALVHAVSQAAHCLAQGKVGSGFDVAAAVFGSQMYTRFNPKALEPLMSEEKDLKTLREVLGPNSKVWDHKIEPFQLPPGMRLMLADVDAGSDTPSLVGKVLKWHKNEGEIAVAFWDALAASNKAFAQALIRLSELYGEFKEEYVASCDRLAHLSASDWASATDIISETISSVRRHAEDIRAKMRDMGSRAGVPIEPPEQTALLNACIAEAGVIAGGVPGAGGYDAVWVLVFDTLMADDKTVQARDTPLQRVERIWGGWKDLDVSPLQASESHEKGLRKETIGGVPGLRNAVYGMDE